MPRHDDIRNWSASEQAGPAPEPRQASAAKPDPQIILDHIADISKNARATWFGLLSLLAFVGVTLLAHKDANFFAYGAETQLPLIGITVPVKAFFSVAPVLVAALYAYLHLYLMTLWDALTDAPAKIGGQPLSDRVYPWLISYAALWARDRKRDDGSAAPRALGRVIFAVSLSLGSLFGVIVLGLMWWRSMPAHDEWLTLWIGFNFWFAALVGLTGFLTARDRMAELPRTRVVRARWVVRIFGGFALVALAFLSWERTEGDILTYRVVKDDGSEQWLPYVPLYTADLREAQLTVRPKDWKPFQLWLPDYRRVNGGDPDQDPLIPTRDEMARWGLVVARLSAPNLRRADLRYANMASTFLPGAVLREAEMQGADLSGAEMQGADLSGAEMQGADLSGAEMQGAVLRWAEMQGADLSGAEMQNADCSSATLRGALLQSADVTCGNLTQEQLQDTVGDSRTVLPDGLNVASCLETLPKDVEAALANYPEEGDWKHKSRAQVRDALLCDEGEKPFRIP